MSSVGLPKVPSFAVEADDILHGFGFVHLPCLCIVFLRLRQDEHARFHLKLVRMPQLLLFWRERFVHVLWDHVLDTNQACILLMTVVYETLTKIFPHVRAVVNRRDVSRFALSCFVGVDVDSRKEFTNVLKWFELLIPSTCWKEHC